MKILFIAYFREGKNGALFGGAEKVFTLLANWLAENSSHKIVFASIADDTLPYDLSEKVIYKHYNATLNNKIDVQNSIRKNTKKAIEDCKPDIIISFSVHPLFYASIFLKYKKIPIIFSIRNDPRLENKAITRLMRLLVLHRANGIVMQTTDQLNYFSNKIIRKSCIIANPISINENEYHFDKNMDDRIVFVGRINAQKNIGLLIDAFSSIVVDYPKLHLEIYGDGDEETKESIIKRISGYELKDKIHMMGTDKNVIKLINNSRMFVLPSLYEGMPNALMEAMALGIPVVASDCPCGGPRELIKNGYNGYLFENNNLEDLKLRIRQCLENKDIHKMRNEERKILKEYNKNHIFNLWLNFIEETVNNKDD